MALENRRFEIHLYGGHSDAKRNVAQMFCDMLDEPSEKTQFEQVLAEAHTVQVKNLAISPHPGIFIAQSGNSIERYIQERGLLHAFVIVVDTTQVEFFVLCALEGVERLITQFGFGIVTTLCFVFTGSTGEMSGHCSEQAAYISRLIACRTGLSQVPNLPWYFFNIESNASFTGHSLRDLLEWTTTKPAICTRRNAWKEAQVGDVLDCSISSVQETEYEAPICVIDQEPILPGQRVVVLPCMHMFHEACIKEYLEKSRMPRCPLDRTSVPRDVASYAFLFRPIARRVSH